MLLLTRWVGSCSLLVSALLPCPNINQLEYQVINKFKATNAGHKDMLAVLAAVTEVKQMQISYDVNAEYLINT